MTMSHGAALTQTDSFSVMDGFSARHHRMYVRIPLHSLGAIILRNTVSKQQHTAWTEKKNGIADYDDWTVVSVSVSYRIYINILYNGFRTRVLIYMLQ